VTDVQPPRFDQYRAASTISAGHYKVDPEKTGIKFRAMRHAFVNRQTPKLSPVSHRGE
jgi:hypothetical protein